MEKIENWWTRGDSNPRMPACKAGAVAAEPRALYLCLNSKILFNQEKN